MATEKTDKRDEMHRLQAENKRLWAGAKELQALVECVMACAALTYGEDVTVDGKTGKRIVLPAALIKRELGEVAVTAVRNETGDYVITAVEEEHDCKTE